MRTTVGVDDRYKWTVLSNTTLGIFMALLDSSIVIISLPAIFRGIHLDPLRPENVGYLLWMLMGYLVATAVLVVTFGRPGDIFGRVKMMYNSGFAIFTVASIGLSLTPVAGSWSGSRAALFLIVVRILQGIGGSLLMANSTAILVDAFPVDQRGLAMGINTIAGITGSFVGLIVGGLLADWNWRLVFWVNVPFGVFGTVWAYLKLRETTSRNARPHRLGRQRHLRRRAGGHPRGHHLRHPALWRPHHGLDGAHRAGLRRRRCGPAGRFLVVEKRVRAPMFDLRLFRIHAFSAGNGANLLTSVARGGLQFMLIIWLQGIWLPLHG